MPKKSSGSKKKRSAVGAGSARCGYWPRWFCIFSVAAGLILVVFVNFAVSSGKDPASKEDSFSLAAEIKEIRYEDAEFMLGLEELAAGTDGPGDQDRGSSLDQGQGEPVPDTGGWKSDEEDLLQQGKGDVVEGDSGIGVKDDGVELVSAAVPVVPYSVEEDGVGRDAGMGSVGGFVGEGSPRLCEAGEADCSSIILPRCLVAVPVASDQVLPCIEDILPVDRTCDGQDEGIYAESFAKPIAGASDRFVLCFHNPLSGSATCGSICSNADDLATSRASTRVCLCGAALQSFLLDGSQPFTRVTPDSGAEAGPASVVGEVQKEDDGAASASDEVSVVATDVDRSDNDRVTEVPALVDVAGAVLEHELQGELHAGRVSSEGFQEGSVPPVGKPNLTVAVDDRIVGLDEFKKSQLEKQQQGQTNSNGNASGASGHVRRFSADYNFAAVSHGAKVVGWSKEAKGESYILDKDKDKYLRIPCSTEDKFVVIRLSAETQVETVVISNFEFYASNLKDFELLGSNTYPTEDWVLLGKFQAENVRHPQRFEVAESRLVRYVKLRMLTHYGSDFYCTLSMVEVLGVDEIESLLEGWIPVAELETGVKLQPGGHVPQEDSMATGAGGSKTNPGPPVSSSASAIPVASSPVQVITSGDTNDNIQGLSNDKVAKEQGGIDSSGAAAVEPGSTPGPPVLEALHHTRPSGEAVLKMVMQKVKSLELNQSLFDQYVDDLNVKIQDKFHNFGKELLVLTERLLNETAASAIAAAQLRKLELRMQMESEIVDNIIADKLNNVTAEFAILRFQVKRMENRETRAVLLAFLSTIIGSFVLLRTPKGRAKDHQSCGNQREKNPASDPCLVLTYLLITWNITFIIFLLAS